jgi:HJR/Mrr/RecB family endonuclease
MDPFDHLRQIERHLAGLQPALEQYDKLQRELQKLSNGPLIRDWVKEFERSQHSLRIAADFANHQQAMIAAIRPFDFGAIQAGLTRDLASFEAMVGRLNLGIEHSRLVGEVRLGRPEPTERGTENLKEVAEANLIEVVPATTLESLRTVKFAPLTLLDRVLRDPELMRQLHARQFEQFIAALVEQLGFEDVVLTPQSGDGGRDVLASRRISGLRMMFAFECKKYAPENPVGPDIARALLGTISHASTRATQGVIVTTSSFTPAAREFIITEPSLQGRDFDGIVDWLHEYATRQGAT